MSQGFSPEAVPVERLERELALLSSQPDILASMVQATLGRPSEQLFASAPRIRCPTLFLHGAEDTLVPAASARTIHARIVAAGGRSRFQLVPGAGHMLIHYQAPLVADLVLRTFLNQNVGDDGWRPLARGT